MKIVAKAKKKERIISEKSLIIFLNIFLKAKYNLTLVISERVMYEYLIYY